MIFDFNYNYDELSFGQRAQLTFTHLAYIPSKIVNTVMELAKMIFFVLGAALALGFASYLNQGVKQAFAKTISNLVGIELSLIGLFAPLNAIKWQGEVQNSLFEMINNSSEEAALMLALNIV